MNKKQLINNIADNTGISKKDIETILNTALDVITGALADGEKVTLMGFGNFEARDRAARKGRNPATGEEINIPASKNVGFKAGKQLKESVNN